MRRPDPRKFTLRLTPKDVERLERLAVSAGLDRAKFMRRLLRQADQVATPWQRGRFTTHDGHLVELTRKVVTHDE
jgi:hypothetical protein